jgi:hypothetical protein
MLNNTLNKGNIYVHFGINKYNMQVEQITINKRRNTSVTIEGHTLKAGMYLYTLIADGKEVDTKKMILTK